MDTDSGLTLGGRSPEVVVVTGADVVGVVAPIFLSWSPTLASSPALAASCGVGARTVSVSHWRSEAGRLSSGRSMRSAYTVGTLQVI